MAWKILQLDAGSFRAQAFCGTPTQKKYHVAMWALVEDTVTFDREVQGVVLESGQLKLVSDLSSPAFDHYEI